MNKTPVCPQNYLLVEIESKYKEIIETKSGIQLYQDTTYRPEWHATVIGKVASVPLVVSGEDWPRRGRIKLEVMPGDEVAFSYLTVFDLAHTDDQDEVYYEDPTSSPFIMQYSNKLGRKLIVRYVPSDDRFDVAALNEHSVIYDIQEKLSELQKENWLGGFTFAASNKITHNNLLNINGRDYWKVDYGHVMAVRREDQLIPIGSNVILDLPRMREVEESKIILLNPIKRNKTENQSDAQVIAIGEPLKGEPTLDVKPGDYVVFDERFVEPYSLWGKDVLVIKQNRLLAKN